eukprot:3589258-Pyramimonas_sp.AAC.1
MPTSSSCAPCRAREPKQAVPGRIAPKDDDTRADGQHETERGHRLGGGSVELPPATRRRQLSA